MCYIVVAARKKAFMAHVTQLNTRMDAQLKAAGDSTLDLYGISPSELIRALWAKIALGEEALSAWPGTTST